jgi:hypothetical protein
MITDLFAPLPAAPLPAPAAPAFTPPPRLDAQGEAEPTPDYRARCLRYALAYGVYGLSLDELTAADQGAQWAVQALPGRLDRDETKHLQPLDRQLHELRHQIHRRQEAHRRAWIALMAQVDQDELEAQAPDQDAGQDQDAPPPETDQDRAVRLLRAGLMLLMGGQDDQDGGGKGARLKRPIGPIAPTGDALQQPGHPTRF